MSENSAKDKDRIVAFESELAADPRSLAFVALAEEHNRLGNYDEAVSVSQKGLVYHPDSVAGRLALAMAESGRNNVKQALEQLKRALLIDQDNPKALAMMGRILLQKGLAKRAVQFLSVAVKLDPGEPEYAELLKRAKKNAEDEAPPVFRADAVKDSASPWSDESESSEEDARRPDAEHTVFDPEALKKLRQRDNAKKDSPKDAGRREQNGHRDGERLDEALANLPVSAIDGEADAEPTRFDGRARKSTQASPSELPPPRRVELGSELEKGHEPPTYEGQGPNVLKRRPKVGGSAAEFSRMMKSAKDGSAPSSAPQAPSTKNGGMADDLSLGSSPPPASSHEPETAYLRPRTTFPPPPPPADQPPRAEKEDDISEDATRDEARLKWRAKAAPIDESEANADRAGRAAEELPKKSPSQSRADAKPEGTSADAKKTAETPKSKQGKPPSKPGMEDPKTPSKPDESRSSKAEAPKPEPSSSKSGAKEAPKVEAPKPEPAKEAEKAVGPASTRMVDEALWALLGGKAPGSDAKVGVVVNDHDAKKPDKKAAASAGAAAPVAAEKPAAKKEKKEDKEDKEDGGKAKAGPGQMVVRTSERFGAWLRASIVLVLAGTLLWVGYATGVSVSGPPPEISSEEVKGIASDLERGGLASLVSAEEKAQMLAPTVPQLTELLDGVLAEIYARRWAHFGRDPEMKKKALEKLQALKNATPTVELISAQVVLSTSTIERSALDAVLENRLKEYPDSPKTWVLRARLAALDGKHDAAEAALYKARGINPQHRLTLLELARWHAKQSAYGAAFNYFDQLQSAYAGDIEVAIERYVLGQISGRDPSEVQATSALAGLVREELVDVADDEVGRASLAFAVSRFSKGDLAGGIEELGKAELSYKESAEFKTTVAGVLLSAGEWDRARKEFKEALEIDPENTEARIGLARATFGERAGLKADPDAMKKTKSTSAAMANLPFGTVRFVFGKFSLVDVQPNREVFPEAAFASVKRTTKGPELTKALEAASMVALAEAKSRSGAHDEALAILEEATKLRDDATARVAYGRVYAAKKDSANAIRSFKQALELDGRNVGARLGLAGALMQKNELVPAVEVLEPLEQGEIIVPQALLMLSRLRIKRGDYEGAARALETLTELQPNDGPPYFDLGEAQHRLRRYDDALETYKKGLKNSSKLPEKLSSVQALYIGRVELDRGNEKKASALLKQAATGDDAVDESHFYFGKFLIKKGGKSQKKGKKELELFRKLQPSGELSAEAEKLLR